MDTKLPDELPQPMRCDVSYALSVVCGDSPATVEGGADIASLCETIVALAHERSYLRADAKLGALVRQIPVMGELTSYNVLRFNTDGSQYGVRVWTLGKAGFHLSKGATPEEALSVLLDGEVPA